MNSSIISRAALRDHWFVVADISEVTHHPRAVRLLGQPCVLWRDASGAVVAAVDRCPHRDAPLSIGSVLDGDLVCAYHGWSFGGDGACRQIPSAGPDAVVPPTARLELLPVRERYGLVWLSVGRPSGEPPEIVQDGDPTFRRINAGSEVWQASVMRMADNFCDVAHFPYVHHSTLGEGLDPAVSPFRVEPLDDDFTGYRYEVSVDGAAGDRVRQSMTTGFALPFTVRSTTRFQTGPDAGSERILLLCSSPIDEQRSHFTFVVWRNGEDGVDDADQIAFDREIGDEDRRMLEAIPGGLPLEASATVSVRADRLSVEWRRRLAELLDGASGEGEDGVG
jgi:phenylpropionate dioxygenase-like ring-hydroxylating dioxygenase large terminal subunit